MNKFKVGDIVMANLTFRDLNQVECRWKDLFEIRKILKSTRIYVMRRENALEDVFVNISDGNRWLILPETLINPPEDLTLTLPLVKGVEEFWGYFEDSEGNIWYTKATKTNQRSQNE